MSRVSLKEAIEKLRKELEESILASSEESLRFEVGEISLELQVEIEGSKTGAAGVNFWVVELGTEFATTSTATHTIKVPLKPVQSVSGREPVFTGLKLEPNQVPK